MRWIVVLLGLAGALLLLALAALVLIPAERIAAIAAERFEAATGRALTIAGPVRPSLWPSIGARVEDVRLANAPWAGAEPMFAASAVDLGLDLRALIAGEIVVTRLEAVAPRILIERDAEGRTNWEFGAAGAGGGAAEPAGSPARTLSVALAQVSNATLQLRDHAAAIELLYEDVDIDLRLPDLAGPAEIRATGRRGGQRFALEARIEAAQRFLEGGVVPLALVAEAGGTSLRFDGRAGLDPLAAEGLLVIEGEGLAPLLTLAGQEAPEPLPAAARPVLLAGQLTLAPGGSLHLREGKLQFGGNRLTVALDLSQEGPRPRLTGEIEADAIDLSAWAGAAGEAGEGGGGWSPEPIDASAVGALDAEVSLRVGTLETTYGQIAPLRLDLAIDRARAVFELREARLHEGRLAGQFVINNRSGLSVGGDLRAERMALAPLLAAFAGVERLAGTGDAELRFLASGPSMAAIMRSLSGEGRLDIGRGEIVGLDLVGMLRNLDLAHVGERNRTIFESLTGSFSIDGGVLRNQDLRMELSAISLDGRGAVDLGARTFDYRLIPTVVRDAEGGRAIRVPLHVTGPWDAPRYRLDLEGLAEERLREERVRLEERARTEIERRLGVEREAGQSGREALEQGARQRLEEELGRGLQRLFTRD